MAEPTSWFVAKTLPSFTCEVCPFQWVNLPSKPIVFHKQGHEDGVIFYLNSCVFVPLKKTKWQRRNHTRTGTRHPAKSSLTFMSWRIRKCGKLISQLLEHHLQDLMLALSPLNPLASAVGPASCFIRTCQRGRPFSESLSFSWEGLVDGDGQLGAPASVLPVFIAGKPVGRPNLTHCGLSGKLLVDGPLFPKL